MKKHESSEGLVNVEAGLTGMKKTGKKSSSCSAGLLLAIIIAILLLLSLVISSLFWAVYTRLTNEQLRIFDSTAVSDLEPLESNDVFVDNLLLRLAAQQNETDRSIPESLATPEDNEEVRVEPILGVPDEPELFGSLATRLNPTTATTEASRDFPEKSPADESSSSENSYATTSRYDRSELADKSEVTTKLELFDDIIDDTAALKVNPWLLEPVENEGESFKDEESLGSLDWLPVTSLLNLFDGKLTTNEKHYRVRFSSEGRNIYVETNTDFFPGRENSTVNLDVDWDEQDPMSSEMSFENLWDWLGSYISRSSESTSEQETDEDEDHEEEDDDDEYSYDDLDYLDYYGNSESYEDTTDESQVVESTRWNDLVDALSVLRIEFLSNYKDDLFSTEDTGRSIPNVLHDLRNYTDTLAREMSDVLSSLWNEPPTALENEDLKVTATNVPEISAPTEISSTMSPSGVENENTETEMDGISGTSEAPASFGDEGISEPTIDSYDYYWYPDEEKLEKGIGDSMPTQSSVADFPGLEHEATLETTKATESDEESEIDRKAVQKMADMLVFRNLPAEAPRDSNEEPYLLREIDAMIETIDDDDVRSMKMVDELLGTMSEPKYNLDKGLLDEIAVRRFYLKLMSRRDSSRSDEPLSAIIRKVFAEPAENSDDDSGLVDDDSQKPARIHPVTKRDVIRRRTDLPPRLLRKKTPSEIFAQVRTVRQVDDNDDIATSSVGMRRDLLKETMDFDSKMERVANHIDRLQDRFFRRYDLGDDYVSKEMPADDEDPRNL